VDYQTVLKKAREELVASEKKVESLKTLISNLEMLERGGFKPYIVIDQNWPRNLKADSLDIFRVMLSGPKTADMIYEEYSKLGHVINRRTLVARLAYYKREFDFVQNPAPGLYEISDKGRAYLEQRYPKVLESDT
jgi:hypothetical protein